MNAPSSRLRDIVRELAPRVAAAAEAGDRDRRPQADVLRSLAQEGILRLGLPRGYGGEECDVATMSTVVEEVSAADGSIGWLAATNIMGSVTMGRVEEAAAREIYGAADVVTAGVFAPYGVAERADGLYRVNGRWPFASGCQVADWFLCGAVLFENGSLKMASEKRPEIRMLAFPASAVRVHDTWSTMGLRGTGSHDIEVEATVRESLTLSLTEPQVKASGPLYRMPYFGVCAVLMASVGLGIARSAHDNLRALAREKIPLGARKPILERAWVQGQLAEIETHIASARDHLTQAVERCWAAAQAGSVDLPLRASLRLAACRATRDAVVATDRAHYAAGGSSVYQSAKLERALRDVLTLRQHVMLGPMIRESAAKVLAGVDVDTSML